VRDLSRKRAENSTRNVRAGFARISAKGANDP